MQKSSEKYKEIEIIKLSDIPSPGDVSEPTKIHLKNYEDMYFCIKVAKYLKDFGYSFKLDGFRSYVLYPSPETQHPAKRLSPLLLKVLIISFFAWPISIGIYLLSPWIDWERFVITLITSVIIGLILYLIRRTRKYIWRSVEDIWRYNRR